MSTLLDRPKSASYSDGNVTIVMESGLEHRFPARNNPRLSRGTDEELRNFELSPFGIHWPDLDEELSFRGIQAGDYGQRKEV